MFGETINIKSIILLLLIPAATGILFNFFSDTGIAFIMSEKIYSHEEDLNLQSFFDNNDSAESDLKIISLDQAFKLFSSAGIIFIDARDKWDFAEGHIKNAINIPEYNFDPISEIVLSLDKDKLYVIYCNDNDCETSQRLAAQLSDLSFRKLYIFEEGWSSWQAANYPIEKSEIE